MKNLSPSISYHQIYDVDFSYCLVFFYHYLILKSFIFKIFYLNALVININPY